MRYMFLRLSAMILTLPLFALTGCLNLGKSQTPPAVFYQLNSLADSNPPGQADTRDQSVAVGVGPINFPEYLNRPQMVIRNSQNELELDEFHRWAEPLKRNFSSVLAENLSILLSTDRIVIFPYSRFFETDYRIVMRVIRFDGNPGDSASLVARWSVLGDKGRDVLIVKKTSLDQPTGKDDIEALVSVQSRMVEALSREIASAIKDIAN